MTYRYTFYNIPYMRGGVDVPALNSGDIAETQLEKYFIMEIFSQRQFSEEQVQLVFSEGESLAASQANYMRVAKTQNTTQKDYSTDSNVSFWWVDDVQLLGAINASGDLAARVTISPDVWLTDFFAAPSAPSIQGRIIQTTVNIGGCEKKPPISPNWNYGVPITENMLVKHPPTQLPPTDEPEYSVVVFMTTSSNDIIGLISEPTVASNINTPIIYMCSAAKITLLDSSGEPLPTMTWNVDVVRAFAVPRIFIENLTDYTRKYKVESAPGGVSEAYGIASYQIDRYNVVYQRSKPDGMKWDPLHYLYFGTAKRLIKVDTRADAKGGAGGSDSALMSIAVTASMYGTDTISINLFLNGEIIDLTDDFECDFAVNEKSVSLSQFKSLTALKSISSVIGAAGGVVGGVMSGNYFGAIQSIFGGIGTFAELEEAKKQPATMEQSSGNVVNFIRSIGSIYWVYSRDPLNIDIINEAIERYGYIYEEAPVLKYANNTIPRNEFFKYSEADVYGMTGGQSAAIEISNAFLRGVRLKTL